MLTEVLEILPHRPGAFVVDGTVGLGGHAGEIIARIAPGGIFVGLDWDEEMLRIARENLSVRSDVSVTLEKSDYRGLPEVVEKVAEKHGVPAKVDGILLDLGLNSAQIEDESRGISFQVDAPLDFRMDKSQSETAASLLNRASPGEIERLLRKFGDENWARRISEAIVKRRKAQPLRRTSDLVGCVLEAIPPSKRERRIHPATRTFQAVRIAVNKELDNLEECLENVARMLAKEGLLVVLSYHSGEDRAVKRAFRKLSREGFSELFRKPCIPTIQEVRSNPRSRSAKLRALKRVQEETT